MNDPWRKVTDERLAALEESLILEFGRAKYATAVPGTFLARAHPWLWEDVSEIARSARREEIEVRRFPATTLRDASNVVTAWILSQIVTGLEAMHEEYEGDDENQQKVARVLKVARDRYQTRGGR